MKIYVGNLNYGTTAETVRELFAEHGEIEDVHLPTDRHTGRPRGFGFVTMPNDNEAQAAINALNGAELEGRRLTVNQARPRPERGGGGGRRW